MVDAIVVSCADDQAAIRAAKGLLRKDRLELWHMDRKVAEFKPPSKWIKWNPLRIQFAPAANVNENYPCSRTGFCDMHQIC